MVRFWLLALAVVAAGPAIARGYQIDDVLKAQSYGEVLLAPRAGLVLYERRRPYDEATDYSLHYFVRRQLSVIRVADAASGAELPPLLPEKPGEGYWLGPLSPSGLLLSVFRLDADGLSLGIVDLRSRAVRWLSRRPDLPLAAPAPTWIGDRELAFVAMPGDRLPMILSLARALQDDLPTLWKRQRDGGVPSADFASAREGPEADGSRRLLVVADVATGLTRELLTGDIVDVAPSPDRTRFAVVLAGAPVPPPSKAFDTGFIGRRHAVVLLDGAGRIVGRVPDEVLPGSPAWRSDGRGMLVVTRKGGSDWSDAGFGVLSRDGTYRRVGGSARAATEGHGSATSVGRGWSGSDPVGQVEVPGVGMRWAVLRRRDAQVLAVPATARLVAEGLARSWYRHGSDVLIHSRAGLRMVGGVVQVGAEHLDPFSIGTRISQTAAFHPFVSVTDAGSRGSVVRSYTDVDAEKGGGIRIEAGDRVLASGAGRAVVLRETAAGVQALHLVGGDGRDDVIDVINRRFSDLDPIHAIRLRPAKAGPGATSWLYLPDASGAARHPLVVIPYPGMTFSDRVPREDSPVNASGIDNVRLLLAAGYAVLRPGMPATTDAAGRPGAIVSQVDQALDAALATGRIDAARVAVMGHSFGGYAALVLATRSRRFRAVIAESGIYDLVANHGTMAGGDSMRMEAGLPFANAGWTEGGQGAMQAPPGPWSCEYVEASPGRWLADVRVPLLLMHGDVDTVGVGGAERVFLDLARLGGDVSLLRYRGEGHVLFSPANMRDYQTRILAFLGDRMARGSTSAAGSPLGGHPLQARNQDSKLSCTTSDR